MGVQKNEKALLETVLLQDANTGYPEKQFELGAFYWIERKYFKAEQWFRYAARQNYKQAQACLAAGVHYKHFINIRQHLNRLAIEILEQLITPHPTEEQISKLEQYLSEYLEKEFTANQTKLEGE